MATTTFNDLITFSRGTNATLTGPNGLIQWAPSNLLTNSQDFDAAAWSKSDATVTANATAAPDGTLTADKLAETATTAQHFLFQNAGAAGVHTVTIYAKAAERSWLIVTMNSSNTFFNLGNGTVGSTPGGFVASVTAVGNEWYRCVVTATLPASGAIVFSTSTANNVTSYAGTAGNGIFIWGAQLELGGTATAYNNTSVRNLLGFSEAFDNAFWTKSGASIVTGAQANPVNGLFNAQKLMEDTAVTAAHGFSSANVTTVVGTPMTASFYAKAAGRSWIVANAFNSVNRRCWFDLANGTAGTTAAGCTTSITSVGGGWYRCAIIQTAAATTMSLGLFASTADGVLSYTGDGNSGVFVYGAQLSNSASLDPYVPTPAAAPSSTAYYGPRLDYDPVTLQPRGFLVEEARTNVILTSTFATLAGSAGSQYPSGTGWSNFFNTGGTRTFVASSVFSGAQAMDVANVSAARNLIGFSFAAASSTTYTVSFYVEAASGVTGIVAYATGALGTGGTTNNVTAPTTTGRYSYTFTTGTSAGTVDLRFGIGCASNESGSIRISNVQCEAGAFATSYIPTIASTVTRSADIATISGSLFSQWWNAPEGTFVVDLSTVQAASNRIIEASAGTSSRVVDLNATTSGGAVVQMYNGTAAYNSNNTFTLGSPFKTAGAYRTADYAVIVGGGSVRTDTSTLVNPANALQIGRFNTASNYLNGHIRSIRYYPVRAADFQLQALTT
jgi:hypothetical protein